MDPLSDVLSLLKARTYMSGAFDAGGKVAVQFPRHDGIKCYALVSGQCWLKVDGVPEPVRLQSGDCFLLPRGRAFRLASDLDLEPVDYQTVISAPLNDGVRRYNGGGDCFFVGGHFAFAGSHAGILLEMLPPIMHIRKESDRAALRWSLDLMMREVRDPQPGGFLVVEHLAHMILVQALRLYLEEGARGGVGWLFALADKQMSAAISAIHDDPAHRWTLRELAKRAGMSRSTFALRFKEKVGTSPMEYLARWRMLLAGDRLMNSGDSVGEIALALGYESESAFSTAFRRVMGCSPRRYGRGRTMVPASASAAESAGTSGLKPVPGSDAVLAHSV